MPCQNGSEWANWPVRITSPRKASPNAGRACCSAGAAGGRARAKAVGARAAAGGGLVTGREQAPRGACDGCRRPGAAAGQTGLSALCPQRGLAEGPGTGQAERGTIVLQPKKDSATAAGHACTQLGRGATKKLPERPADSPGGGPGRAAAQGASGPALGGRGARGPAGGTVHWRGGVHGRARAGAPRAARRARGARAGGPPPRKCGRGSAALIPNPQCRREAPSGDPRRSRAAAAAWCAGAGAAAPRGERGPGWESETGRPPRAAKKR